jgi:hypothetical protein
MLLDYDVPDLPTLVVGMAHTPPQKEHIHGTIKCDPPKVYVATTIFPRERRFHQPPSTHVRKHCKAIIYGHHYSIKQTSDESYSTEEGLGIKHVSRISLVRLYAQKHTSSPSSMCWKKRIAGVSR